MEQQPTEQNKTAILASAALTEPQVQTALAEFLLKNEELKDIVANNQVRLVLQWQTHKWSDPNALVHVFFTEAPADASPEISTDSDSADDPSGPDLGAPLGSPFFKEAE